MCLTRIYHYVLTADYVVSDTAVADKYGRDGVWVMDIATNPVEQIELLIEYKWRYRDPTRCFSL